MMQNPLLFIDFLTNLEEGRTTERGEANASGRAVFDLISLIYAFGFHLTIAQEAPQDALRSLRPV